MIQERPYFSEIFVERSSFRNIWKKKIWFLVQCWFHILEPNVLRLLVPYVMVLWCLTRMSFSHTLGCSFGVNISFIWFRLRLLTVLKISMARTFNRFISIVTFPLFLSRTS